MSDRLTLSDGCVLVAEVGDWDYSWWTCGVFYNPSTGKFHVETDCGCSCYGPWEDVRSAADFDSSPTSLAESINSIRSTVTNVRLGDGREELIRELRDFYQAEKRRSRNG